MKGFNTTNKIESKPIYVKYNLEDVYYTIYLEYTTRIEYIHSHIYFIESIRDIINDYKENAYRAIKIVELLQDYSNDHINPQYNFECGKCFKIPVNNITDKLVKLGVFKDEAERLQKIISDDMFRFTFIFRKAGIK